ncbi:antitoxin [Nitrospira sp. T9]|uniref:antitoxin n=1 Tax=unclassified Nitrospira TaxID=2652172 RepID=UPI003F988F7F
MSRLSIELTPEQHQRLKAMAALQGKTIKEYILERSLPDLPNRGSMTEEEALHQLEQLLQSRIEAAERGEISTRTPAQIFESVRRELS